MAQAQTPGRRPLGSRARAYVWLVAGCGIGTLIAAARAGPALAASDLGLAASLLVLGILAQHYLLEVALHHKIDMSLAAYFAALLLFPPAAAVVLVGVAQALGQATLALRRNPDIATIGPHVRRTIHWLHTGMREERHLEHALE